MNKFITIDCGGPPLYYTRSGSEITFDVSNGSVTNVHLPTSTGDRALDDLYANATYKQQLVSIANSNKP